MFYPQMVEEPGRKGQGRKVNFSEYTQFYHFDFGTM